MEHSKIFAKKLAMGHWGCLSLDSVILGALGLVVALQLGVVGVVGSTPAAPIRLKSLLCKHYKLLGEAFPMVTIGLPLNEE